MDIRNERSTEIFNSQCNSFENTIPVQFRSLCSEINIYFKKMIILFGKNIMFGKNCSTEMLFRNA